ncbi:hypothetical protein [Sphingomonas panacisoli]|uniref:hypothetical protein n=1 Tax=Sphingomonas panacisoli TaxID=1813879 RepID=UPI001961E020|nr:hypothetical protein [Sphingomonas panacisoli]
MDHVASEDQRDLARAFLDRDLLQLAAERGADAVEQPDDLAAADAALELVEPLFGQARIELRPSVRAASGSE